MAENSSEKNSIIIAIIAGLVTLGTTYLTVSYKVQDSNDLNYRTGELVGDSEKLKQEIVDLKAQYEKEIAQLKKSNEDGEISVRGSGTSHIPVGTIITSILPFQEFCDQIEQTSGPANFDPEDQNNCIWSPADGRNCKGSKYASAVIPNNVPDLRGVFLRGRNIFDESHTPGVSNSQKDPSGVRKAGSFQADELERHRHFQFTDGSRGLLPGTNFGYPPAVALRKGQRPYHMVSEESIREPNILPGGYAGSIDGETRPKNIAVYRYIKIN